MMSYEAGGVGAENSCLTPLFHIFFNLASNAPFEDFYHDEMIAWRHCQFIFSSGWVKQIHYVFLIRKEG